MRARQQPGRAQIRLLFTVLLFSMEAPPAAGQAEDQELPADAAYGKGIFKTFGCSGCHDEDAMQPVRNGQPIRGILMPERDFKDRMRRGDLRPGIGYTMPCHDSSRPDECRPSINDFYASKLWAFVTSRPPHEITIPTPPPAPTRADCVPENLEKVPNYETPPMAALITRKWL